jgi:hypothetical protein
MKTLPLGLQIVIAAGLLLYLMLSGLWTYVPLICVVLLIIHCMMRLDKWLVK